jgi:hypothetical protein
MTLDDQRSWFMKPLRLCNHVVAGLFWTSLLVFLAQPLNARAAAEETLDMLQAGTQTYQNVTVTTKSKDYILIVHSTGMASLRVTNLPPDVLKRLGYAQAEIPKGPAITPAAWTRQAIAKVEAPEVKEVEQQLMNRWRSAPPIAGLHLPPISTNLIAILATILLAIYVFACYCCKLIVQKTGHEPGVLVWVPVLQTFPLLRAAGMSPWWFLAFLVPVLNLVAQVLWCLKIADARGKTVWVAVLLLLPVTSFLAFLYLAFSGGERARKNDRRVEIMTLEAA